MLTRPSDRFHYSLEFEDVLRNLLGDEYRGVAGRAVDVQFLRQSMLKILERWRERVRQITTVDDRLDLTTNIDLDRLERAVSDMSATVNTDWKIISGLASLVNHILGYDWHDGKVHRHVVIFRDREQEDFDYTHRFPSKDQFVEGGKTVRIRYSTINHLKKVLNLDVKPISHIMGISQYLVRQILKRIAQYEKAEGPFPTIEDPTESPLLWEDGYQKDAASPFVKWNGR